MNIMHTRMTHDMSYTREYATWNSMLQRCRNKMHIQYPQYGGRGIEVDFRWYQFENFYADMGPRPTPNHSLDRINNEDGYYKENCRWATREDQQRNTRANVMITHNGQTRCLAEWAAVLNISYSTITTRHRRGWEGDKLFSPTKTGFSKRIKK